MKVRNGTTDSTLKNACLDNQRNGMRDLSILQNPIETSITGFEEVVRAYQNGTEEFQQLLANECDIIYECRTCRNIFRSIANFLNHKRTYCIIHFNSTQHFHFRQNDQDITTIIQDPQIPTNGKETKETVRNLSSVIDRLTRPKHTSQVITLNDLYEQASQNLTQDEVIEKKKVLQLEKVGTQVAVFQTLKRDDDDSIRKEVNEIYDMTENVQNVLGPDFKVDGISPPPPNSASESSSVVCKMCKLKFLTEQMLKIHIKREHISSTNVYPCKNCPRTFLLPKALIRHLHNDHKMSRLEVRAQRDRILKGGVQSGKVQWKPHNRELNRLQNCNGEQPAKQRVTEKTKVSTTCHFCGENLERRAALVSHVKNCPQRGKDSNTEVNVVEDANVDKSETIFIAMLKKEKEIQASVQKSIDQEESQLMLAKVEDNSRHGNDSSEAHCDMTKNEVDEVVVVKNKRKRRIVQKVQPTWDEKLSVVNGDSTEIDRSMEHGHSMPNIAESEAASSKPLKNKKKKKLYGEKNFECNMCIKTVDTIPNLKRHVAMYHYRQKTFGCKLCKFAAYRNVDIVNHLSLCHQIVGTPEICEKYVVNIPIDIHKFTDEKMRAVALAIKKVKQKLSHRSNGNDRMPTVDLPDLPDVTIHPIMCSETSSAVGSSSNSPDKSVSSGSDTKEKVSNGEKVKKRGRRFKATKQSTEGRTISQNSSSDSLPESQPSNRPIRNRVKVRSKDFVYDLSNLLRKDSVVYKEQTLPSTIKTQRRKMSQMSEAPGREKDSSLSSSSSSSSSSPL